MSGKVQATDVIISGSQGKALFRLDGGAPCILDEHAASPRSALPNEIHAITVAAQHVVHVDSDETLSIGEIRTLVQTETQLFRCLDGLLIGMDPDFSRTLRETSISRAQASLSTLDENVLRRVRQRFLVPTNLDHWDPASAVELSRAGKAHLCSELYGAIANGVVDRVVADLADMTRQEFRDEVKGDSFQRSILASGLVADFALAEIRRTAPDISPISVAGVDATLVRKLITELLNRLRERINRQAPTTAGTQRRTTRASSESRQRFYSMRSDLERLHFSIKQALDDCTPVGRIPYITDFSLLYPHIWPGRARNLLNVKSGALNFDLNEIGRQLFEHYPVLRPRLPFDLTFSLPTILELENSILARRAEIAQLKKFSVFGEEEFRQLRQSIAANVHEIYIDREGVASRLADLIERVISPVQSANLQELAKHLVEGTLLTIGDVASHREVRQIQARAQERRNLLYHSLQQFRPPYRYPTEGHRSFANLLDATNIAFCSEAMNTIGRDLPFLGPVPPSINRLPELRTRSPLTPALMIWFVHAAPNSSTTELRHALQDLAVNIEACFADSLEADALDDLPPVKKRRLSELYASLSGLVAGRQVVLRPAHQSAHQPIHLLRNSSDLIAAVEGAERATEAAIRYWSKWRTKLIRDDDLDDFDIRYHPQVQKNMELMQQYSD